MKKQVFALMLALSTTTSSFCMNEDPEKVYIKEFCKKYEIDPDSALANDETILDNTYNHYNGRVRSVTSFEVPWADFHLTYLYYNLKNSQGNEFNENSPVLRDLFARIPNNKRSKAFRVLSTMLGDSITKPRFPWDLRDAHMHFWDLDSKGGLLQELLALPYEPLQGDK
jgi:hypothetical protein